MNKIIDLSDEIVKIPILGEIESLNASVAGGIVIYKYVEQLKDANPTVSKNKSK